MRFLLNRRYTPVSDLLVRVGQRPVYIFAGAADTQLCRHARRLQSLMQLRARQAGFIDVQPLDDEDVVVADGDSHGAGLGVHSEAPESFCAGPDEARSPPGDGAACPGHTTPPAAP